jgi:hypothetical protein
LISPPAWLDWHEPWLSWPYNPLISCMGTWLSAMLLEWLASDKKSKDAVR